MIQDHHLHTVMLDLHWLHWLHWLLINC